MTSGAPATFVAALHDFYGPQVRPPGELFQFFVWEILGDGALPARRDLSWHALKKIPALTPDALFRAPKRELSDAVGLAGAHREERLQRLLATVDDFKRYRDDLNDSALREGSLLHACRTLQRLAHVDAATRRRALLFSTGFLVLPVDDEVRRVVNRLAGSPELEGSGRHASPRLRSGRRARRWLAAKLPRDLDAYREALVYLRHHAQHTCVAVGPHCGVCPLRPGCPAARRDQGSGTRDQGFSD